MTEENKKLVPIIWDEIQKSQSILLHCHPSPDADSIGGALAMMHMLESKGKKVSVIAGDSEFPQNMSHLPGYYKVIRQNFFELDLKKYDLFLIQDSGALNQISKKGSITFPQHLKTIVIDHHASNPGFADINLIDLSYPATCQIIYDLFKEWNITITPHIAECLILGIYSDTGGFKYAGTTPDTFKAAAELAEKFPEFTQSISILENSLEDKHLEFISLAFNKVEKYFGDKVSISTVSYRDLTAHGIEMRHTEKLEIANWLKAVIGCEIGISFFEIEPEVIKVSMRSRNPHIFDVSKIAVATGVGGGHKAAAGARITRNFDEAKKFLFDTIQKVYPELGNP